MSILISPAEPSQEVESKLFVPLPWPLSCKPLQCKLAVAGPLFFAVSVAGGGGGAGRNYDSYDDDDDDAA